MNSEMQILNARLGAERVQALVRELLKEPADTPCCAYVFGSVARDEARVGSDLDLALLFEQDPPRTLAGLHLGLADRLSIALGQQVDLVILNRAPVDLIHRILRDGLLVLDSNPARRIAFEVDARNRYFDLLPYLRRYRLRRNPLRLNCAPNSEARE